MNTMPGNTVISAAQISAEYKFNTVKPEISNPEISKQTAKTVENTAAVKNNAVPSVEQVDEALQVLNKAAVFEQRSLSFMVDEASGKSIIKVMDKSTEQVIRQIPSEELLKVAQDIKRLQEEMGQSLGFLIDRRV